MIWIHSSMLAMAASLFILQHVQAALKSPPSDRCLMEFASPVKYKISCRYGLKGGASLIKGFEIRVDGQKRGYRCIVIELDEKVNSSVVSFSGIMTSIEQNKKYVITLQSLPRNNASGTLDVVVTTPSCASNISGDWAVSEANITYDHVTETLHVAFKGPPQVFGFDEFTLELLRLLDYTVIEKVRINETQHTFNNIKPGEYVITVQPFDTYFQQDGRCKCKNKRNVCSSCTMSQMKYVAKPKLLTVAVPPEAKKTILVAGVTAGILVLALAAIAIIVGRRRRLFECFLPKRNNLKCTDSHVSKPSMNGTSGADSTASGCLGSIINNTDTSLSQTSRTELLSRLDVPTWNIESRQKLCPRSRERYVSSDSGKGGSVESCKYSPLEDNLDASDETENDFFLHGHYPKPFDNVSDTCNGNVKAPFRCPSEMYFAPPEPSEVSESDILENYRYTYNNMPNGYAPMLNMRHARVADDGVPHCGSRGVSEQERVRMPGCIAKSDDNSSMDRIMGKMAAINARSLHVMNDETKGGETYSVFEANV